MASPLSLLCVYWKSGRRRRCGKWQQVERRSIHFPSEMKEIYVYGSHQFDLIEFFLILSHYTLRLLRTDLVRAKSYLKLFIVSFRIVECC